VTDPETDNLSAKLPPRTRKNSFVDLVRRE